MGSGAPRGLTVVSQTTISSRRWRAARAPNWTVPGAPQDAQGIEEPNRNDWVRRGGLGIKEGSVVRADDTLYMGFGFEGIAGANTRKNIMDRAVDYLLR